MKKIILSMFFALVFFSTSVSLAQVALRETSLKQQIDNSSLVIEGKVISKKSFWSDKMIYTANTIEVYKVFKGEVSTTVEVITLGGNVGLQALIVSSSLKLNYGDVGVFALENTSVSGPNSKSSVSKYRPYGAIQGFYKYNIHDDVAVNSFNVKNGISDTFYDELTSLTKSNFTEVSSFNVKAIQSKSAQSKNSLAPSVITFSPMVTTAGTKSTITITIPSGNTGTDFGVKGKVAFSNADDGGLTFVDALDSQVTWSNTSITVEVPSNAGTGKIRVTNNDDSSIISDDDLIIVYAEANVVYDEDDETGSGGSNGPLEAKAYPVQHINENGNGGYTWQMYTDFNSNTAAKEAFERAFETWRCTTKINWTIGSVTSVDQAVFESAPVDSPGTPDPSVNVIRFDNGSELGTDVLGTCYSWYKGCSLGGGNFEWYVEEMDIVFDDATNWNFGPGETSNFGDYDFESVALHELGHGHQLAHVINTDEVMHFGISFNEDRRVLSNQDIEVANNVQARSNSSPVCSQSEMTNYSGSCTLGLEDDVLNENIRIYPNPTKGNLFISYEGIAVLEKVAIYDLSGRLILQQDISNSSGVKKINLNNVSKGLYFVNIYLGKAFITKKIILE